LIVFAQLYALGGLVALLVRATRGHDDNWLSICAVYLFWPIVALVGLSDLVRGRRT
jgi:hypothetical protein